MLKDRSSKAKELSNKLRDIDEILDDINDKYEQIKKEDFSRHIAELIIIIDEEINNCSSKSVKKELQSFRKVVKSTNEFTGHFFEVLESVKQANEKPREVLIEIYERIESII